MTANAGAFGSLNSVGQNAEHEHITREIGVSDPAWQPNSLSMLAGKNLNLGGVGAPDRPWDTSSNLLKGSGPAYKHCDDGDYLNIPNYPQSAAAAQSALESCIDYYQSLMDQAVVYAGSLVGTDLSIRPSLFTLTDRDERNFSPDKMCTYKFSLAIDEGGPKCNVMNALGRALHMAEDIYAHTNWADLADPTKPISATNPPGLGQTGIPSFLRYPAETVVPEGLISGCDDTASGAQDCSNRVAHSTLAKDNGDIREDGSTSPTSKYPRGEVTVNGVTNFQRAVDGGKKQAVSTWADFKTAVIAKYGSKRGEKIISVIQSDKDPSVSTAGGDVSRQAGALDANASNTMPASSTSTSAMWWTALAVLAVVALIIFLVTRNAKGRRNA